MTENPDVTGGPGRDANPPDQPPPDEPITANTAVPGPAPVAPVLKTRWRDRAWTFRAMLAVALATLVIGGIAGGVLGAAAAHHHDRRDGYHDRFGPGMGPGKGPGWRMRGGPGWRWDRGQQYGGPGSPLPSPSTPSPTAPGSAS